MRQCERHHILRAESVYMSDAEWEEMVESGHCIPISPRRAKLSRASGLVISFHDNWDINCSWGTYGTWW